MAPLIPWIESAKVGSKSLAYVIWLGSDFWGDRIHCVIFYGDEATMYIRARTSTYIYIYIYIFQPGMAVFRMGGPVQFSDITEDKPSGFNQETNSRREQLLLLLTNSSIMHS